MIGGLPDKVLDYYKEGNQYASENIKKYSSDFQKYIDNSHKAILDLASNLENKKHVLILGVGLATAEPLTALAEMFEKITIVDIDPDALKIAFNTLPLQLQGKVTCIEKDISGGYVKLLSEKVTAYRKELKASRTTQEKDMAWNKLCLTLSELEVSEQPSFEKADFVISSLLLSQLPSLAYSSCFSENEFEKIKTHKNLIKIATTIQTDHIVNLSTWTNSRGLVYFADTLYEKIVSAKVNQNREVLDKITSQSPPMLDPRIISFVIPKRFKFSEIGSWDMPKESLDLKTKVKKGTETRTGTYFSVTAYALVPLKTHE